MAGYSTKNIELSSSMKANSGSGRTHLAHHHQLRVNQPERVNYDFPFHALNRVNDDTDSTLVECLKRLLRVDVDTREPASEADVDVYQKKGDS